MAIPISPVPQDLFNLGHRGRWFEDLRQRINVLSVSGGVDHTLLANIGSNTHAQIDTALSTALSHRSDATIHFTEGSIDHTAITNIGSNSHSAIDTHIADGTIHFTEGSIDHTAITNIGTNTHAQIDTHIADATLHFTEGSIDHGSISGLADDDHTQYFLVDGTRDITGNLTVDGSSLFNDNAGDNDFTINKNTADIAFIYDAGLDEHKIYGANVSLITNGSNTPLRLQSTVGTNYTRINSSREFTNPLVAGTEVFGEGAGRNTTGTNCAFMGYFSGGLNTTSGRDNCGYGSLSGYSLSSGIRNAFYGNRSGQNTTVGGTNCGFGNQALQANISGGDNCAFGSSSLALTTGGLNCGFGSGALAANTSGTSNSSFGTSSLLANITGATNCAFGAEALKANLASNNAGFGYRALLSNTTGNLNCGFGDNSLRTNTIGIQNCASGSSALYSNLDGNRNSAQGNSSLYDNTSGSNNIASGYESLRLNTTGSNNVGFGASAGYSNTTGDLSVFIGFEAGYSETVSESLHIANNRTESLIYGKFDDKFISINGGLGAEYIAKTATYTVLDSDFTIDCTANTFTVTLLTAVSKAGRMYNIKNSGAGTITLDTTSSQTIDGGATATILAGECVTVQSDGANWIII